jgi:hypothetical protein
VEQSAKQGAVLLPVTSMSNAGWRALGPIARVHTLHYSQTVRRWSGAASRAEERAAPARRGGVCRHRQSGRMALGLNALHTLCQPARSPRNAVVMHGAAASWGWEGPIGRQRQHRLGSGLQPHRPHEPLVRLGVSGVAVSDELPELRSDHNSRVRISPLLSVLIHPKSQQPTTCVDAVTHSLPGALSRATTPPECVHLRVSVRETSQDIEHMSRAYAQAWMGYQRSEVRIVTTTIFSSCICRLTALLSSRQIPIGAVVVHEGRVVGEAHNNALETVRAITGARATLGFWVALFAMPTSL